MKTGFRPNAPPTAHTAQKRPYSSLSSGKGDDKNQKEVSSEKQARRKQVKLESYAKKKNEIINARFFDPSSAGASKAPKKASDETEALPKKPKNTGKAIKDLEKLIRKVKEDNAKGYVETPAFVPKIDANGISELERRLFALRAEHASNETQRKIDALKKINSKYQTFETNSTLRKLTKITMEWNKVTLLIKAPEVHVPVQATAGNWEKIKTFTENELVLNEYLFKKAAVKETLLLNPSNCSEPLEGTYRRRSKTRSDTHDDSGDDALLSSSESEEGEEDEINKPVPRLLMLKTKFDHYLKNLYYIIFFPADKRYINLYGGFTNINFVSSDQADLTEDKSALNAVQVSEKQAQALNNQQKKLLREQAKIYEDINQNIEYYKLNFNNLSKNKGHRELLFKNLIFTKSLKESEDVDKPPQPARIHMDNPQAANSNNEESDPFFL